MERVLGVQLQKPSEEEHEAGDELDTFHAKKWTKKYAWQERKETSYECDYSDEYLQQVFGVLEENCEACREDWRNIGKNQILLRNEIMERQGLFDDSMTGDSENLGTGQAQVGGIEELPMNLDITDDDISVKDRACNEPSPTEIPSARSSSKTILEIKGCSSSAHSVDWKLL